MERSVWGELREAIHSQRLHADTIAQTLESLPRDHPAWHYALENLMMRHDGTLLWAASRRVQHTSLILVPWRYFSPDPFDILGPSMHMTRVCAWDGVAWVVAQGDVSLPVHLWCVELAHRLLRHAGLEHPTFLNALRARREALLRPGDQEFEHAQLCRAEAERLLDKLLSKPTLKPEVEIAASATIWACHENTWQAAQRVRACARTLGVDWSRSQLDARLEQWLMNEQGALDVVS